MAIPIFIIIHWYSSLFCQTFFQHRYAAHKMFTMSKIWEKIFFIFSFITQGSSYLSPYAYGILHRMHHAYADTEKDPHSPSFDRSALTMMWRTKTIYSNILQGKTQIEERFMKDLPQWLTFEKIADKWFIRFLWIVLYTLFYVYFTPVWWVYFLLPIHFVMGPLHGAIINWFAHKYGSTNFRTEDTAKNLLPVDILMMGEGYHNNHHSHPNKANFGAKWFEIDFTYPIIKLFHIMGIIRLKQMSIPAS